ncbi:MAG: hypothetical protein COA41_07025 [Sphingopyxis sp.]|nr:MAG: hypothetical protein COA41_07025 [Sphingopyxis sp.]
MVVGRIKGTAACHSIIYNIAELRTGKSRSSFRVASKLNHGGWYQNADSQKSGSGDIAYRMGKLLFPEVLGLRPPPYWVRPTLRFWCHPFLTALDEVQSIG